MSEILNDHPIFFDTDAASWLSTQISKKRNTKSKIFVLADEHTKELCLPTLKELCPELTEFQLLEISSGELNKTIDSCTQLWKQMLDSDADRNCMLINLGGGIICDLGGFVAAGFKRGIQFVNIPTTLLGQVDAAVGGKVGVNLQHAKNQVGFFADATAVLVFPIFLETLDSRQLLNGFAEMIKHAVLSGPEFFNRLVDLDVSSNMNNDLIKEAIAFKMSIVRKDRMENDVRKILNFGHTFGHAIESFSMQGEHQLLHGEAIAYGMIMETLVSVKMCGLDLDTGQQIISLLRSRFEMKSIDQNYFNDVWQLMLKDKKSKSNQILMVGLKDIGQPVIDVELSKEEFVQTMNEFNKIVNF